MSGLLKISDAASLALHSMAYVAENGADHPVSVKEIARAYSVSEAHLSKVIQRLAHTGIVKTTRGPSGGVMLAKPAKEITLLTIYEAIEGPIPDTTCLLGAPSCDYRVCILGDLLSDVNFQVRKKLSGTRLSEFLSFAKSK